MFDNGSLLRRRKRFKQTKAQRIKKLAEKAGQNNQSSSFENNNNNQDEASRNNEFDDDDDENMRGDDCFSDDEVVAGPSHEYACGQEDDDDDEDDEDDEESKYEDVASLALGSTSISSIEAEMIMMKNKRDVLPYLDNGTEASRMLRGESDKEKRQLNAFLLHKTESISAYSAGSSLLNAKQSVDLNTLNRIEEQENATVSCNSSSAPTISASHQMVLNILKQNQMTSTGLGTETIFFCLLIITSKR